MKSEVLSVFTAKACNVNVCMQSAKFIIRSLFISLLGMNVTVNLVSTKNEYNGYHIGTIQKVNCRDNQVQRVNSISGIHSDKASS